MTITSMKFSYATGHGDGMLRPHVCQCFVVLLSYLFSHAYTPI